MNPRIAVVAVVLAGCMFICFESGTHTIRPKIFLGDSNSEALEAAQPQQLPGSYG